MRRFGMLGNEYAGSGLVGGYYGMGYGGDGLVGGAVNRYPFPIVEKKYEIVNKPVKRPVAKGNDYWKGVKDSFLAKYHLTIGPTQVYVDAAGRQAPAGELKEFHTAVRVLASNNEATRVKAAATRAANKQVVHQRMSNWYANKFAAMQATHPATRGPSDLEQRMMKLTISHDVSLNAKAAKAGRVRKGAKGARAPIMPEALRE